MKQSRFSKQAHYYAKYRPTYPREMFKFIFNHIPGNNAAWDCATGSGQIAQELARHFTQVYANDISDRQLSYAPDVDNIHYYNISAEDTGFPSTIFDLITTAQAIHWFDIESFYQEVFRVSRRDALLAVIGYGMVEIDRNINPLIRDFADRMFSLYFSKNRKLLDRRYKTIPFPFREIHAPVFRSELKWTFTDLEGFINSWSPVQKYKSDYGKNPAAELLERIKTFWNEDTIRNVSFPVFLRLGQVC